MPNSGPLFLGENITLVLFHWSFGIFGGFSWNDILSCVDMMGSFTSKLVLLFWVSGFRWCVSAAVARTVLASWALSWELHRRALLSLEFE